MTPDLLEKELKQGKLNNYEIEINAKCIGLFLYLKTNIKERGAFYGRAIHIRTGNGQSGTTKTCRTDETKSRGIPLRVFSKVPSYSLSV